MNREEEAILVTGTSSGIGRSTALHLDGLGFRVFAGVRKEKDGQALRQAGSDRLTPLHLDVTDLDSVVSAVGVVQEETKGPLHALVNNAGVSLNGPLELVPLADIRTLMEVNVLGLLSVTKALLPQLIQARGHLINISSGHGLLAIPDKSVYAASKSAVEAISDAMRVELRPFGVSVSSIIVGKVNTEVLGKIEAARATMLADADPEAAGRYAPLLEFFDREVKKLPGIAPEEVARVVAEALLDRRPKARYLVGPGARKMRNLARLPQRLRDGLLYKAIYGSKP